MNTNSTLQPPSINPPRTPRYIRATYLTPKPSPTGLAAAIVSILIGLLFSQVYWKNIGALSPWLAGSPIKVFQEYEFWRLFTGLAVHGDLGHLLSNSLMFFVFSYLLNGYFGFWVYPFWAIVLGAVVNGITLLTYSTDIILVGASGVVYLMAGIWLSVFFFIETRYSVISRALRVFAFTLVVLAPSTFKPEVSYRAHFIGFIVGLFFGVIYYYKNKETYLKAEQFDIKRFANDQLEQLEARSHP